MHPDTCLEKSVFSCALLKNLIGQLTSWIKILISPHEHGIFSTNDTLNDRYKAHNSYRYRGMDSRTKNLKVSGSSSVLRSSVLSAFDKMTDGQTKLHF